MSDDRTPPQDRNAEMAVLGAMLLSKDAIEDAVEAVRADEFYLPQHEAIYDAITGLYAAGQPVDPVTVGEELSRRGFLGRVGGAPYLHTLMADAPIAANTGHHAAIIAEKAAKRRLINAGTRIVQMGYATDLDGSEAVDAAEAELMAAIPRRRHEDYHSIGDLYVEAMDAAEAAGLGPAVQGVPTGFYDLDDLLGGFKPGQMVVVAGRPAMGKSTLVMDVLRAASVRHRMCSVLFSLEMTRQEVTQRLVSAEAKVPLSKIRSGDLSDDDWRRIAVASNPISQAPLYVDDTASITMTEIRAKARRLKMTNDLRLIGIDYMQLMSSGKRVESRQTEVSEFSRQIKLLAKELEVPVIALSQLNRGPEQRTSKRPMMSDLRESGSIEQDADIVMLLHREDAYELESVRPGEADIIVAKHRNGATRDITVAAQLHYSRFADIARA